MGSWTTKENLGSGDNFTSWQPRLKGDGLQFSTNASSYVQRLDIWAFAVRWAAPFQVPYSGMLFAPRPRRSMEE